MAGGATSNLTVGTVQRVVTTTTNVSNETISLTGKNAAADTWGKQIPLGWGANRTLCKLVWSSPFYNVSRDFSTTTAYQDIARGYRYGDGLNGPTALPPEVVGSGSTTTTETHSEQYIDMCFSAGKEGDPRKRRYVKKIFVNDTPIYDVEKNYVAEGIGFNIRYGYEDPPTIDPVMAAYEKTGKFFYPHQTLIILERFPLALYGNAIPQSFEVEFGCCLPGPPPDLCLNPGPHYVRQQVIASTGTYGNKVFLPGMQAGDFVTIQFTLTGDLRSKGISTVMSNQGFVQVADKKSARMDSNIYAMTLGVNEVAAFANGIKIFDTFTDYIDEPGTYIFGTATLWRFDPAHIPEYGVIGAIQTCRGEIVDLVPGPLFLPEYGVPFTVFKGTLYVKGSLAAVIPTDGEEWEGYPVGDGRGYGATQFAGAFSSAGDDPQKGKQINIANGLEGHYIEMILTGYCGDLA